MNFNKDPESWAKVKPDAFLSGSIVQARNVIEMALQDIARMDREAIRLRKALYEAQNDIAHASNLLSAHIEEFHDFDYEPHAVPFELQQLQGIAHHLDGSLMSSKDAFDAATSSDGSVESRHAIGAAAAPTPNDDRKEAGVAPGPSEATIEAAWQSLLDKDDRTSPEEYPEMALITREELAEYMALSAFPPPEDNCYCGGGEASGHALCCPEAVE